MCMLILALLLCIGLFGSEISTFYMQDKYKVYNLCSERLYDASLFEGKVCRDLLWELTWEYVYYEYFTSAYFLHFLSRACRLTWIKETHFIISEIS